jgi:DNA-binding transcriptional MerR regulator
MRVEELAEAGGVSVETLRSYQSKGLLPPPRHEGRVAFYSGHHLDRLRTIKELKDKGYSLRAIARLVEPESVDPVTDDAPEQPLTLREVAERSRVPPSMLRSLEGSGLLRPRRFGEEVGYTQSDVRAVRMILSLVSGGLPMEEFMRVAQVQIDAVDTVAQGAVDLFLHYVREPLLATGAKDEPDQMVEAFRLMLHATTSLVAYNFQRAVLNAAQDEVERNGSRAEKAAFRREAMRRSLEVVMPA